MTSADEESGLVELRPMQLDDLLATSSAPVAPRPGPIERAPSTVLSDDARLALLDALPVAVFLIDQNANVRFANQRTSDMLGIDRTQLYGCNVLDFVLVEDLDFAADLLNTGSGYSGQTMGPSRVRYLDAAGDVHWTQVWANAAPPGLGIDGFIVTLTSESVRDVLATAITSVATGEELDSTLAAVALSARAMPLCGRGAILAVEPAARDDQKRFRAVGDWPIDPVTVNVSGTPWHRALVEGVDADVEDVAAAGLAPAAKDLLLAAGVNAIFVRVILDAAEDVIGVYVVFRHKIGAASVNQNDHLRDAVRLASLGFARTDRRIGLESEAHQDSLTGVSNRTAFMERL